MSAQLEAIKVLLPGLSVMEITELKNCCTERLGKQDKKTMDQKVKMKMEELRPGFLQSLYRTPKSKTLSK